METDRFFRLRILFVTTLLSACFVGIAYKLCVEHFRTPDESMQRQGQYCDTLPALRGRIFGCQGQQPIVVNLSTRRYFVDPHVNSAKESQRTNLVHTVSKIAAALALDADEVWNKFLTISRDEYNRVLLNKDDPALWEKLRQRNRYSVLKDSADEQAYAVMADRDTVSGVGIENKQVRGYPAASRMPHVVGFVNYSGVGASGIELQYDALLRGTDGRTEGVMDARRQRIPGRRSVDVAPVSGADLHLTLDPVLQEMTERVLRETAGRANASAAWSVIQRVRTGEILAMASWPDFDPQCYNRSDSALWVNKAIAVNYEPGSVMAPIIACAALNQGIIAANTRVDIGTSNLWHFAGQPLRDQASGELNMREALAQSSNIYFAKLGLRMGSESLYNALRAFGFGSRRGIDLPGEQEGILYSSEHWDKLRPTRIPIGHGIAVTALQLVSAYACLANDGVLMKPYVVSKVIAPDGAVIMENQPQIIGRPVSQDAARAVRAMLIGVTREGGTGARAAVRGYTVAGKAGTAQKPEQGGYSQTECYASFAGFIPAVNPEVAILITVESAEPGCTGAMVAAPAFSELAAAVVRCLEIPPDDIAE